MFEIKKILLNELEDFVKSEMFQKLAVIPITPARAESYLKNPRGRADDVVLYLGFIEDKLVAFRSLFADSVFIGEEQIRFAWCSGSWVHPAFRREGHSKQLLTQAYSDWNGKLVFTNYAPESEKLYVKTGWFKPIHQFEGVRCYLFPKTRKLVAASGKNKLVRLIFCLADFFIKIISLVKINFFKPKEKPDFWFEEMDFPDSECYRRIQQNAKKFLFKRGEEELKWIFGNPWISTAGKQFKERYPFSSFSKEFYYRTVKIFRLNRFAGFFIFSVREGHLKTLYFQIEEGTEKGIAAYLKRFCTENKLEIATVYNSEVAGALFKQKFPFLRVKKTGQKIYSTFAVPGKYNFQDGDGDVFFT